MSDQIFKVKCVDCGEKHEIVSPAHLICQKCGSGQIEFPNAVIFKCHMGHEQRGKISDEVCGECFTYQRKPVRHFERLMPESTSDLGGDKDSQPSQSSLSKAPPPDDPPDEDEETEEREAELELKKKKRAAAKKKKAAEKKKASATKIKTRTKK